MKTLYKYLLSDYPLRADLLEVYTDTKGRHRIQLRTAHNGVYIGQYKSIQKFLDGLQDE